MKWTQDRLRTARSYLDKGMTLSDAAKEMGIHRKSLTNALKRHWVILPDRRYSRAKRTGQMNILGSLAKNGNPLAMKVMTMLDPNWGQTK